MIPTVVKETLINEFSKTMEEPLNFSSNYSNNKETSSTIQEDQTLEILAPQTIV